MPTQTKNGFTLIELIFTLAIASILLSLSMPSFADLVDRNKISAEVSQLRGSLQLGRKAAITQSKKVTLCPTINGEQCSQDWSDGYMVFIDDNEDRQLDPNEELLLQSKIGDANIKLRWCAFGVRSSFQWHQTGITNHQNGTFQYCYTNKPELSRGLFISKAGRIRMSKDENGDGIHENASGNNIDC